MTHLFMEYSEKACFPFFFIADMVSNMVVKPFVGLSAIRCQVPMEKLFLLLLQNFAWFGYASKDNVF